LRQSEITIALPDAAATRALGARLGAVLRAAHAAPTQVALSGELGSGKTTLVAGLLAAFGVSGPVRSPTYTLIEPYAFADREVLHCDLYRLESPGGLEDLGLRDTLVGSNVLLVEWPERAGGRLGVPDLEIHLRYAGLAREATLRGRTPRGVELIARLAAPGRSTVDV
jgi:tRNA threonylcarbamoyladenosine biosynthesis protein TsaE